MAADRHDETLAGDAPAGLYRLDASGAIAACNARFAELLGLDGPAGAVGTRPLGRLEGDLGEHRATGADGTVRTLIRCERPAGDGGRHGALVDGSALFAARDHTALARSIDVSGRALGAVGHELNNLLAIILNYSTMIAGELTPQHPLLEDLREVQRSAQRAVALARKLLVVGRREASRAAPVDVGEIAGDVVASVGAPQVTVQPKIAPGVKALVDPSQCEAILRALVDNAIEAMPDGGRLAIEVGLVTLADHEVPGVAGGPWARLRVADNGRGMNAEVLEHAVEPFFTTKPNAKGVGVGLTSAFARARQAGGHLVIESTEGAGTQATVYLPVGGATAPVVDAAAPRPAPRRSPSRGMRAVTPSDSKRQRREVVLVVDDEDGVRALVSRLLGRQGYVVLEARGPGEALLLAERHAGTIDLLLTDVMMPTMNGKELAERLVALRPGLHVLLMSGFTGDVLAAHLGEPAAFLQKPFTEEALALRVRAAHLDDERCAPRTPSRTVAGSLGGPVEGRRRPTWLHLQGPLQASVGLRVAGQARHGLQGSIDGLGQARDGRKDPSDGSSGPSDGV